VITISARDQDPVRAAAIADAAAAQLIAAAPTIDDTGDPGAVQADLASLRADIDRTQSRLDDLLGRESPTAAQQAEIERLRAQLLALRSTYTGLLGYAANGGANRLTLIQPAVVPTASVEPRPLYFALVAAVTGLLVAVALAFLLEWRDDRLRDGREVEEAAGLPVLGAIPNVGRGKGGPSLYDVGSPAWDAADALRIGIDSLVPRSELSSITIVSPRPQEGRTTLAANLAVAFASAGRPVLLVDADLVHPRVHSVFGMEDRFGLTAFIRTETASVDELALGTFVPGLRVLTSGRAPADGAWRRSGGVEQVMERLGSTPNELVIYDVPPLSVGTIALGLAARTDATLLVTRLRKTPRSAVRDACSMLGLVNAKVLGVAVHGLHSIPPTSEAAPVRQKAVEVETPTVAYGTPPRVG
jgi:capsular exopolysaccharide synthesis family protein